MSVLKKAIVAVLLAAAAWGAGSQPFTILFFNDFHGRVEPFELKGQEGTVGGVARLAAAVRAIREENAAAGVPTFLLVAGDVLQGSPYSTVYQGAVEFACLNEMGVNALCLGNHEFDYGSGNLRDLMKTASFPVLAANVTEAGPAGPAPFAGDVALLEAGEVRIGVIGLTTPETPYATAPANVAGLTFAPTPATAKDCIRRYRGRVDVFMALTHQGYAEDRKLAEGVPELAIIVGGHSHTRVDAYERVGEVVVCQAYEYGEYLGRLDVVAKEGGRVEVTRYELIPITDALPADPAVAAVVASYKTALNARVSEVVGVAASDLLYKAGREGETNFGDFVADCLREATGADVALVNSGGMRADIPAGEVTYGQVLTALPFANEVWVVRIRGRQLKEALDLCAREKLGSGGFLQVSGLTYTCHPGVGAEDIAVAGAPVDEEATYRLAVSDFLAAGGDGYAVLAGEGEPVKTGLLVNDLVITALREAQPIPAMPQGRIVIRTP